MCDYFAVAKTIATASSSVTPVSVKEMLQLKNKVGQIVGYTCGISCKELNDNFIEIRVFNPISTPSLKDYLILSKMGEWTVAYGDYFTNGLNTSDFYHKRLESCCKQHSTQK